MQNKIENVYFIHLEICCLTRKPTIGESYLGKTIRVQQSAKVDVRNGRRHIGS